MKNECIPKSAFLENLNRLSANYVFLAVIAFAISFIKVRYFGAYPLTLKVLISFIPALIYSIAAKSIAKPRFVLAYAGVYVCLYLAKLLCMNLIIIFVLPFFAIKLLIFGVFEFTCSLIVFWVTNLISYGIIKFTKA